MNQQMSAKNGGEQQQIMMERPGQPPIVITIQDAVNIMQQMQQQIQMLTSKLEEKDTVVIGLQKQLSDKIKLISELKRSTSSSSSSASSSSNIIDKSIQSQSSISSSKINIEITEPSKCNPIFMLDIAD